MAGAVNGACAMLCGSALAGSSRGNGAGRCAPRCGRPTASAAKAAAASAAQWRPRGAARSAEHVRGAHRAQVADQRGEAGVAQRDAVDVDHRHDEARRRRAAPASVAGAMRGWVRAAAAPVARSAASIARRSAGEAVAAGERADERRCRGAARGGSRRAPGRASLTVSSVPTATTRSKRAAPKSWRSSSAQVRAGRGGEAARRGRALRRASATAPSRAIQAGSGTPISKARSKRRWMSPRRSRHSAKARSWRNSSGPMRAARSRRSARRRRSNRSGGGGSRRGLCDGAAPRDKGAMATMLLPTIAARGDAVARFRAAAALRGVRRDHRRGRRLLRRCWLTLDWLGNEGCERCGLPLEATEARTVRALPRRAAAARPDARRGGLWRRCRGRSRSSSNMAARSRWRGPWRATWRRCAGASEDAIAGAGAAAPPAAVVARVQPGGAGRAAAWAARGALPVDQHLLRRVRPTPPLKGMNAGAAAQRGRRGVRGGRRAADRRADGDPDRRRADHAAAPPRPAPRRCARRARGESN